MGRFILALALFLIVSGLIWGFLNRNNRPPPPVSLEDKRAEREKRKRNRDDPRD
tara:strand:+ start:144 stop:305 length:162 start_codon:yes stop_codon:yes gene_type:complete